MTRRAIEQIVINKTRSRVEPSVRDETGTAAPK
jgi:hypothetical protein